MSNKRSNGKFIMCVILAAAVLATAVSGLASGFGPVGASDDAPSPAGVFSPEMLFSVEFGTPVSMEVSLPVTAEAHEGDNDEDSYISDEIRMKIEKAKSAAETAKVELAAGSPQILIYHTHTTESYRQAFDGEYIESDPWRTNDNNKNITAVGEALKNELSSKYGFNVLHDYTNHEPPKLATAYSRSVKTMEKYREQYPDLKVFIDMHRDAADVETAQDDVVTIDGKRCARVMFVVGTGTSDSTKNLEKPYFDNNYSLAEAISNRLMDINRNFTRDIRVKPGRYNQHISDACLLIEIGHNANTLEEALNSVPYIAKAMAECLSVK